jgi:hypothetical protein
VRVPPAREGAHPKGSSRKSGTGRAEALRQAEAFNIKLRHAAAGHAGGFMKRFNTFLAATFMSAAMLFTSAAQAMEIRQFDKMADQDQNEYVAELVVGADKVLRAEGRADLADQVDKLFTEKHNPGDEISLGRGEFEMNLARARLADAKRIQNDPNARRLEVEDAMIVTLRKNNIELPPSFLTVASNFQPKLPPKEKPKEKK